MKQTLFDIISDSDINNALGPDVTKLIVEYTSFYQWDAQPTDFPYFLTLEDDDVIDTDDNLNIKTHSMYLYDKKRDLWLAVYLPYDNEIVQFDWKGNIVMYWSLGNIEKGYFHRLKDNFNSSGQIDPDMKDSITFLATMRLESKEIFMWNYKVCVGEEKYEYTTFELYQDLKDIYAHDRVVENLSISLVQPRTLQLLTSKNSKKNTAYKLLSKRMKLFGRINAITQFFKEEKLM